MTSKKKGFYHEPTREQIEEYRRWPIERRLAWLLAGNRLRRLLPERTVELQEKFRRAEL